MIPDRDFLNRSFEELKENRIKDTTNLLRVQIDIFINILKEIEDSLNSEMKLKKFKSTYFGTDKTLSETGSDLIYSILENIDFEWERLIITFLDQVEKQHSRKLRKLESELIQKIDTFSKQMSTAQYSAGLQMDKLKEELMQKVENTDKHRKELLKSLKSLLEEDVKRLKSSGKPSGLKAKWN